MAFQRFAKSHNLVCREFHSPFYPDARYHHKTMIHLTTHQVLTIPVHDSVAVSTGAFFKKGVFRKFAKFTGKHLCKSLLFNTVAG